MLFRRFLWRALGQYGYDLRFLCLPPLGSMGVELNLPHVMGIVLVGEHKPGAGADIAHLSDDIISSDT